ncbi:MAG: alpha/beta hydrolase family protein [Candidatus Omnitrophota bacterium]
MNIVSEEIVNVKELLTGLTETVALRSAYGQETNGRLLGTTLGTSLLNEILETLFSIFKDALEVVQNSQVSIRKTQYTSLSSDLKNETILTGLLIIPRVIPGNTLPIMCFQHGTEILKDFAPSQYIINKIQYFIEVLIGMIFAASGKYAVLMTDYQGLGDDETHIQPFVVADSLSQSVVDFLRATKDIYFKANNLNWDQELFLTGYSEGGYVTMATAQKIQEKYANEFTITACAPLAGPYSISEGMRLVMIGNMPYRYRHFLPMTIRGYNARYGDTFAGGFFTKKRAFKPEYQHLWDLVDGYHSEEEVIERMPPVPREILSNEILRAFEERDPIVLDALRANDTYNWKPRIPMQLFHARADEVIPYANSEIAQGEFRKRGIEIPIISINPLSFFPGPVHLKASIPCFAAAYNWFEDLRIK